MASVQVDATREEVINEEAENLTAENPVRVEKAAGSTTEEGIVHEEEYDEEEDLDEEEKKQQYHQETEEDIDAEDEKFAGSPIIDAEDAAPFHDQGGEAHDDEDADDDFIN